MYKTLDRKPRRAYRWQYALASIDPEHGLEDSAKLLAISGPTCLFFGPACFISWNARGPVWFGNCFRSDEARPENQNGQFLFRRLGISLVVGSCSFGGIHS